MIATLIALPSDVVEFVLLPLLDAADERALYHALRSIKLKQTNKNAFSHYTDAAASTFHPSPPYSSSSSCSALPILQCFQTESSLLNRVKLRLTASLTRFAAIDEANIRSIDTGKLCMEFSVNRISLSESSMQYALAWLPVAAAMNLDEALQRFQQPNCYPPSWDIISFFDGYVVSRSTQREPETPEEEEEVLPFVYGTMERLPCSLNLRASTLKELRAFIHKTQSSSNGTDSSSPSSSFSLVEAGFKPLTVSSLQYLQLAVDRSLSLLSLMRAEGCIWIHCLESPTSTTLSANYQLHPFLLRWPTTRSEWMSVLRIHFPDFATTEGFEEMVANEQKDTNPCCNGMCNPDARLNDDELLEAMRGTIDPSTNEFSPAKEDHWTRDRSWKCSLTCPESHQHKPFGELVCPHHLQMVRGCLWWNCWHGEYGVQQLLVRMLGLKPHFAQSLETAFPRPGLRTDWTPFFQRLPPFVEYSPEIHAKQVSAEVQAQLTETFPWSFVATVAECMPAPAFFAAPLAPGFVGGFIAAADRSSH